MEYIMLFMEGVITFISPCLLPMLPLYFSYLAGQKEDSKEKLIKNAIGFIIGFTIIFVLLGAFASSLGMFVKQYNRIINIVFGIIVILFGLNFMDVLNMPIINRTKKLNINIKITGFLSSILFGIIFAVGWTPCIGTFLGSALMLATVQAHMFKGISMLLCYSLGLGIPFLISAFLIDKLRSTIDFIKKHYEIINKVAGVFLIAIGILMITGFMERFLAFLTF